MTNMPFSSDEDFNDLRDKDRTVYVLRVSFISFLIFYNNLYMFFKLLCFYFSEVVGYVHQVQGAQEVGRTIQYVKSV